MYLLAKAIEAMAAKFEDSERQREAKTYKEYVDVLRNIMRRHRDKLGFLTQECQTGTLPPSDAHTAATGPDGIPASVIKCLGSDCKEQLASFFTNMLDGEEIPKEWRLGRVVLILKIGGNTSHLSEYKPLTVTCTLYRTFTQVIKD
ncbi:hypothetical protein MRX96_027937 [Rhipicephalus microplus]